MSDHSKSWLAALRTNLRIQTWEAPRGPRWIIVGKQSLKVLLAAILHFSGATGWLLRRGLRTADACLILGYHGVSREPPHLFSRGHFLPNVRDHLRYLARHLRPVRLEEIAGKVSRGEAPSACSFVLTFDDGLLNNATLVLPLLQELGIPATFFVPSALVGSPEDLWISSVRERIRNWQGDRIEAEPGLWPELRLSEEESRYVAFVTIKHALKEHEERRPEALARLGVQAGRSPRPPDEDRVVNLEGLRQLSDSNFAVGAHSRTHPILSGSGPEVARLEIEGSRRDLEEMLGRPVLDFAYPNGRFSDFDEATCRLVAEAGYRCAVTTEPGTVRRGDDRLALRRCLPGNVPAFLASFDLLMRVWGDRRRPGDLAVPLEKRVSCLGPREARSTP